MKRRTLLGVILSLTAAVLIGTSVLAAYTLTYYVANTSNTDYSSLPVVVSANNTWMVANHYYTSTGNETRVIANGAVVPHMMTEDKTLFVVPSGANTTTVAQLTTNNSAAAYHIVSGYGGYVTVADNAALEPGAGAFSVNISAYIDPNKISVLLSKTNALDVRVVPPGSWRVSVFDTATYTSPGGGVGTGWVNPTYAFDDNISTSSTYVLSWPIAPNLSWSTEIKSDNFTAMDICGIYVNTSSATNISISANVSGAWSAIYTGPVSSDGNYLCSAFTANVTQVKVWLAVPSGGIPPGSTTVYLREVRMLPGWVIGSAAVPGENTFFFTANAGNYSYATNVSSGSGTGMPAIPATATDWILYADSYTDYHYSAGGTELLWYQPTTFISGTNLPNRASTSYNGTFTWGSNPSGITVNLTAFTPTTNQAPTTSISDPASWVAAGNITGQFTTSVNASFPGAEVIKAVADDANVPRQLPFLILGTFALLTVSLTMSWLIRKEGGGGETLWFKYSLIVAFFGIYTAIRLYDFWMLIAFVIIGAALAMASRQ